MTVQKIFNNIKLSVKINIATLISLFAIVVLSLIFYNSSKMSLDILQKNSALQTRINEFSNSIESDLRLIDYLTIEHAIEMNGEYQKNSNAIYERLMRNLLALKNSEYLKNDMRSRQLIQNMEERIKGYRLLATSLSNKIQESSADGLQSILALSSARQKISYELVKLNKRITQILQKRINMLSDSLDNIKVATLLFLLAIVTLLMYINNLTVTSTILRVERLKSEIDSFFDFLSKKSDKVIHLEKHGNDEIAEIAATINDSIAVAEEILLRERQEADIIKQKVKEGLQEIMALNNEIEATQREIVFTMGAIAEERSKETGQHVKRVAEYTLILARLCGLPLEESILLKNASPMHDIGKIGISDAILNKPARFNDEEYEIMRTHAEIGYKMLYHSQRSILKAAAIIAHEHHERWDGEGYPLGLKGEEIHIYGRIAAIADVFDALGSERVYKKAWSMEKIVQFFKEQRGKQFDPHLIDLFLDNLGHFIAAKENIEDEKNGLQLSKYIEDFEKVPDVLKE